MMRRLYSPNAPYRNFWEQTHITPSEEFSRNWGEAAQAIRTREDLERHLGRHAGRQSALLERLYQEARSILALSAGDGINEFALVKKFSGKEIVLSDIAPEFLEKIREFYGVKVLRMDSRQIAFPEDSFDLVYSLASEYFFDDAELSRMVGEMARVVKAGRPILISSAAVDLENDGFTEGVYRLGQRFIPPAPWVLINRALLGRKLKLTGYSRTIGDFMAIFRRFPALRLEGIHFDYAPQDALKPNSVAFILRKRERGSSIVEPGDAL